MPCCQMQVLTVNIRAKPAVLEYLRVGFCPIPSLIVVQQESCLVQPSLSNAGA